MRHAREIAVQAGLHYFYTGNVPGEEDENTRCHACASEIIRRHGCSLMSNKVAGGFCSVCEARIPGVFDQEISPDNAG